MVTRNCISRTVNKLHHVHELLTSEF